MLQKLLLTLSIIFALAWTAYGAPPPGKGKPPAPTTDTTPPTAPSGLSASIVSSSQINLSWTASTDNVGVSQYRVERCQGSGCANFAQVATPATNSYSDTGLAASSSYSYRIRAADAAGNLSAYSNVADASTPATAPPPVAGTSVLATTAASMAVGSWEEIVTANIGVLIQPGSDGNIISYAWDAAYDPVTKKLFLVSNDHIDSVQSQGLRFVSYDVATNAWANHSAPPAPFTQEAVTNHGYYHHAIDIVAGKFYRRHAKESPTFGIYDIASKTWSSTSSFSALAEYLACCGGAAYFPGLGLVLAQGGDVGGGRVFVYSPTANAWTRPATNLSCMTGPTFTIGAYNPVRNVMVFGVHDCFYKIDQGGAVKRLGNAPVKFYDGSGVAGVLTSDPFSGAYVYLALDRTMWSYDVSTDAWAVLSTTGKPDMTNRTVLATPIPEYGVILYAFCAMTNCHVYIYKHAE